VAVSELEGVPVLLGVDVCNTGMHITERWIISEI
jgi:hypothetical protein